MIPTSGTSTTPDKCRSALPGPAASRPQTTALNDPERRSRVAPRTGFRPLRCSRSGRSGLQEHLTVDQTFYWIGRWPLE